MGFNLLFYYYSLILLLFHSILFLLLFYFHRIKSSKCRVPFSLRLCLHLSSWSQRSGMTASSRCSCAVWTRKCLHTWCQLCPYLRLRDLLHTSDHPNTTPIHHHHHHHHHIYFRQQQTMSIIANSCTLGGLPEKRIAHWLAAQESSLTGRGLHEYINDILYHDISWHFQVKIW